jgi:hypothetical protein
MRDVIVTWLQKEKLCASVQSDIAQQTCVLCNQRITVEVTCKYIGVVNQNSSFCKTLLHQKNAVHSYILFCDD